MDILWSGALLVPVIVVCATVAAKERDDAELVGWLALAALLHRYSGASETALDQDLRACRNSDPVGSLLSNLRQIRSTLTARPEDFSGRLNDRSSLLAAYIACRHSKARDLLSGSKINLQDAIDRHHILPRAQFSPERRPGADTIANIAFITSENNKAIGANAPEVYLKAIKKKVLESQCIPTAAELWAVEQAEEFWRRRRELLADAFNNFVGEAMPSRRAAREAA